VMDMLPSSPTVHFNSEKMYVPRGSSSSSRHITTTAGRLSQKVEGHYYY